MLNDMQLEGIEVIQAIAKLNNQAKLNKSENYQENKSWFQVNIHLRKSKPIIETKYQFIF